MTDTAYQTVCVALSQANATLEATIYHNNYIYFVFFVQEKTKHLLKCAFSLKPADTASSFKAGLEAGGGVMNH